MCGFSVFFYFKYPPTTEIYTYVHTLSLHDALPICSMPGKGVVVLEANFADTASEGSAMAGASLEDVLQLRYTLEPFIVGLVAQSISSKERAEEHTSELKSLMLISYAVFCLKKKHRKRIKKNKYKTRT